MTDYRSATVTSHLLAGSRHVRLPHLGDCPICARRSGLDRADPAVLARADALELVPEWRRPLAGALSAVLLAGAAAPAGTALAAGTSSPGVARSDATGAVNRAAASAPEPQPETVPENPTPPEGAPEPDPVPDPTAPAGPAEPPATGAGPDPDPPDGDPLPAQHDPPQADPLPADPGADPPQNDVLPAEPGPATPAEPEPEPAPVPDPAAAAQAPAPRPAPTGGARRRAAQRPTAPPRTAAPQPVAATPPAPVAGPPAPAAQPSRPLSGASYVVRAGDTLWSIAQRTLPRGASAVDVVARVHLLAHINRAGVADPDLIMPGWRLRLP